MTNQLQAGATGPEQVPAIEFIGVSKNYGSSRALRSVTFRIDRGDSVVLLGSNGAGKTTVLKIAATHATPSSGSVKICGEDAMKASSSIRSRIGFVSHGSCLYNELTVRENLCYYARLFSVKDEERVHALVSRFGLSEWYDRPVSQLSYGLRKRADIVRASIHCPEIFLLDEPFSGLDAATCNLFVEYFQARKKEGACLLLSSHSPHWAQQLCGRSIILQQGRIGSGQMDNEGGAG